MASYDIIGTNQPDGCQIGIASTDKVGFFGTTPADQPASSSQAAVTALTTTHTTTTIAAVVVALTTLVNQMRTDLVELGLIKGAA